MSEEQVPSPSTDKNSKKEHSYTYWVDHKTKSRELPPEQQPQKIFIPSALKKEDSGRSDWNKSGTWQQRKIEVSQIQKDFTQALIKWLESQKNKKTLKKVSLNGQFQSIFSRNKKNLMYDLNGKVQFQSEKKLQMELIELNDQGDRQYGIKAEIAEEKEWLSKSAKSIIKIIDDVIVRYRD